ncbi:MAG: TrbI/VirB10 family protein [Gammaproteobacteria bacterium]
MSKPNLLKNHSLPKAAGLNKPVVLIAVAVVVFVIAFSILNAFRVAAPKKTGVNTTEISNSEKVEPKNLAMINEMMNSLPNSYQETSKIQRFQVGPPVANSQNIPDSVQQELKTLREQQITLEQRLSAMVSDKTDSHKNNEEESTAGNSPQMQQAKSSSLSFPGLMPTSATQTAANTSGASGTMSSPSSGNSDYNQQNAQDQKKQFLEASADIPDIYDQHQVATPISPFEVQAGTLIPAVLITGINSSLPGDAIAQVRQDIYDTVAGKYLLIPKGSKIMGAYDSQISYGQRRVLIAFTRVIRPDGSSILLSKSGGADLKGQAGMEGDVDNHWMRILGAATLSTILSVGTGVVADRSSNNNTYYPSAKQGAILGAASGVSQVGQSISNRALNIQPTLMIPPGFLFNIIVQKDMILTPYKLKNSRLSDLSQVDEKKNVAR